MVSKLAIVALGLSLGACAAPRKQEAPRDAELGAIQPLAQGEQGFALLCGKVFTLNEADDVFAPGLVVVRGSKVDYAGPVVELPEGYELVEAPTLWATPGLIDLHSHIQTGGWGDINDMVLAMNPEYRTSPTIVPANPDIQRACSAGVTTLFGIPGSGTNNSGFGVLYKTRCSGSYEGCVLADPGGMKVAQAYNPERRGDLGATRTGMAWTIEDALQRAEAANAAGRDDKSLANLQKVVKGELPVLIHTAGSDAVHTTIEMWGERYPATKPVLSHGCFDGWKVAPYAARIGIPVNLGPRTFDWRQSEGEWVGTPERYAKAGANLITVNTDAPVMPQEELFLQSTMGARYGADSYLMLKACTVNPAKSFGIDALVGSLRPGRHADIVLWHGDPLDPRASVESVWIEGKLEYDRVRDRQRF
ncbi:MAG: amidohydrolase family protein [Flavobacteriales bacterium]|jgi:imidazolonepropionase-like amidohydrolase|nr:amidohydrolase family protein [Flavobacteriales bacterium]